MSSPLRSDYRAYLRFCREMESSPWQRKMRRLAELHYYATHRRGHQTTYARLDGEWVLHGGLYGNDYEYDARYPLKWLFWEKYPETCCEMARRMGRKICQWCDAHKG